MVCLSACLDFNNEYIKNNIQSVYNQYIQSNQNTNATSEMGIYNLPNNKSNNLGHFNNNSINNTNNTNARTKHPISIEYNIIEYGKYGEQDKKYYYNYIDKHKNKTIIAVYAGKKPIDYNIKITKIIKNSNNSITVYINKSVQNNSSMLITSPYVIVEVSGIFKDVKFIDN